MKRDTLKEGLQGRPIKSLDNATLDGLLGEEEQETVRAIVKNMPEESVSMQWRSSLNEKLLALAPVKKRLSPVGFAMRALVGVAAGCLICFAYYTANRPKASVHEPQVDAGALASALISAHRQTVVSNEIDGIGAGESDTDRATESSITSDSDSDSDSL